MGDDRFAPSRPPPGAGGPGDQPSRVDPRAGTVLREQLDYLELVASRIGHLRGLGLSIDAIVRELFGGESTLPGAGITWQQLSGGEFSSRRWVNAFLRSGVT